MIILLNTLQVNKYLTKKGHPLVTYFSSRISGRQLSKIGRQLRLEALILLV
jgi:hypothetical protein